MSRMGNSRLWGKIAVLIAFCGWGLSAQAKYDGGSGEPNNPYQIGSVADWQALMATPADWAGHFVLTTDIDLNDVAITPIGSDPKNFTGVFDGNDYVIRNADVNIPGSNYVALFGYLGWDGQIKNLAVEHISVIGRNWVGGLVGTNGGAISNCYSTGSVTGDEFVGGLAAFNSGNGKISNCYSSARVSGTANVAGVAGSNFGTIGNCYSISSVTGSSDVGGLVGENNGAISNCCSTGSVSGMDRVGGLGGYNNEGTVTNCYSTGSVSGTGDYVGGLVGSNSGNISRSFWDVNTSGWTTSAGGTGKTTSQMQDVNTFLEGGWDFLGETANGTCNFWLMLESGGYPVLSTFNGYVPPEPSGSGTEAHPYIITDANELGTVWYRPSASYVMANHIDLAGISWSGSLVPLFDGVFDGNGHTLRDVDVNVPGAYYVGVFGYLGRLGRLKNLGAERISIFGRSRIGGLVGINAGLISNCCSTGSVNGGSDVGGLVGTNSHTIYDCHSSASVNGSSSVGGLVGSNYGSGNITTCYSTGSVSGTGDDVGGLAGSNRAGGAITNCYSIGSVGGRYYVAGLVGRNADGRFGGGPITNCYSTGSVAGSYSVGGLVGYKDYRGTCQISFWDVNTSGQTKSAGGTPKTTAEMKTESTFTSTGWDFIGETANGTEDIWAICEGTNYSRFVYQIPQGDIVCPDGVNSVDYSILARYWHETDCAALDDCEGADIDLSGAVDFGDVAPVAESWLRDVR